MKNSFEQNGLTQAQASMMDALESLLCEKPLSSIDVKQLCERAHVARSTFYSYYRNIDELMERLEDKHVFNINLLNEWVVCEDNTNQIYFEPYGPTLDYLDENSTFLYSELAIHHNGRLAEKWKDAIKCHLQKRLGGKLLLSERVGFVLEVASSAVVSACIFWLKNPSSASRNDVHAVINHALAALPTFAD